MKGTIVIFIACASTCLFGAAHEANKHFLPLIVVPAQQSCFVEERIQESITRLEYFVDNAKRSLISVDMMLQSFAERPNKTWGIALIHLLQKWEMRLKSRRVSAAEIHTLFADVTKKIEEIKAIEINAMQGCYAKPIEHIEQEGSIINKSIEALQKNITNANVHLTFLKFWINDLKNEAEQGQPVTKRIEQWAALLHAHESDVTSLSQGYKQLVDSLYHINEVTTRQRRALTWPQS